MRLLVHHRAGESEFTLDPDRHMLTEAMIEVPTRDQVTGLLPDSRTAQALVQAFFDNATSPSILCHLNLVFALGLVLAQYEPSTEEARLIEKLRSNTQVNRAEAFFRNGTRFVDPVLGFEDANLWSLQALVLMVLYMLSVTRRNAAYIYLGKDIFGENVFRVRRGIWRTLFILDRFIAAALGRPVAISEEECSPDALDSLDCISEDGQQPRDRDWMGVIAMNTSVETCRAIGLILHKLYLKQKISAPMAQDIATQLGTLKVSIPPVLNWRQLLDGCFSLSQGIVILHANLLCCHSIILLTRPFFLYMLNKAHAQCEAGASRHPLRISQNMDKLGQICVEACQHTLAIAQAALSANYLSQSNPFVIHFVFAAGLVILSNEFALLYHNPEAETAIKSCMTILNYCAERDAQAKRVSHIIKKFHESNTRQPPPAGKLLIPGRNIPTIRTATHDPQYDPIAHFIGRAGDFTDSGQHSMGRIQSTSQLPVPLLGEQQVSPGSERLRLPTKAEVAPSICQNINGGIGPPETEFDLTSVWPSSWPEVHRTRVTTHQPFQSSDHYGGYGLDQHQVPALGNILPNNINISLYPSVPF
ncbi:hypothetical protein BX600DRAFT_509127 [Xylariales sp. PMI_506]|nr:hypothetical protein BX600DRAFT_509127 [Xylariales sp. PMI_506]